MSCSKSIDGEGAFGFAASDDKLPAPNSGDEKSRCLDMTQNPRTHATVIRSLGSDTSASLAPQAGEDEASSLKV